jgi:hypothetical protein
MAAVLGVAGLGAAIVPAVLETPYANAAASCQLNSAHSAIQHVIYIQFDNVHFTRDNPNVPSDLEQMPSLLNFIENDGVLLTNHHTPLISHTADDILTSLTGMYPDRNGMPVANSYGYFDASGVVHFSSSFKYWTDPVDGAADSLPNMVTTGQLNTPAPWVPYTRAGCNVGAVGTANTEFENTTSDITQVFGANSPQAAEAKADPNQAAADFVGVAVHCAQSAALCGTANGGEADMLPEEPGGYSGYNALFGHKYVGPQISPSGPLTDLNGNVIQDALGNIGFPGFDGMEAPVSLSYVAAMQEHGIPVTYAYISDAHDNHASGGAYGPGQAGYVAQLKSYDAAFAKFFTRLANDGITASNTLFVITADEGDHFVGGAPSPANCDGVTTPCSYSQIGEIDANMTGLLATQQGITTPFSIHSDDAPTVYLTGNPARDNEVATRPFERATGQLTATNPITGNTDTLTQFMADPVEMNLMHMVTADPARTPTFTWFADPDYFLFTGAPNCNSPCVAEEAGFAWNHGDTNPEITTTWLGMVGPGVPNLGVDSTTWSDHTDIRPTMMALLGLKDDYSHDGRVLLEDLAGGALPFSLRQHHGTLIQLGAVYKQLDASVGQFAMDTLHISTVALESNSSGDSTYATLENDLTNFGSQRDALASEMLTMLEHAEFSGHSIDQRQALSLISQGQALLAQVHAEAESV